MSWLLSNPVLNAISLLGGAALVYLAVHWSRMPLLRRLVLLQLVFIVLHINEELRWPGGFVTMVEDRLHFTLVSHQFGETVLACLIVAMFLPPLLFPKRIFLSMVPMVLGVVEFVMHLAGIWIFDRHPPYTPGLFTATLLLLPVSVYSIRYVIQRRLLRPSSWVLVFLYMLISVAVAQQIVVRSTGMSYGEFLNNLKEAVSQ